MIPAGARIRITNVAQVDVAEGSLREISELHILRSEAITCVSDFDLKLFSEAKMRTNPFHRGRLFGYPIDRTGLIVGPVNLVVMPVAPKRHKSQNGN